MHTVDLSGPIALWVTSESDCRSRGREFDPILLEINQEIFSTVFYGYSPPADSRRAVVSYKGKYVHKLLFNRLVNLAQEKVKLGELTVSTWQ